MNLKLSELRRSKGLTQKQAALLCSTPEGTYKCYEYDTMEVPGVVYGILAAMPDSEVITKDDVVDNVTLGKFLEVTRLSRNLTKGDVAAKIGMTMYGYSKYEHGKIKAITKDVLSKIADALSLDVSDLEFDGVTMRNSMTSIVLLTNSDDIVDNESLGRFLETTRLSKDMLIGDVAAMVGMTRPGYRRYELGQIRHITKDVLGKIAAALSLDVKDLVFKERTLRPKSVIESPMIPKTIIETPVTPIEPPVHSDDITEWLRSSDSTQWVAMAYYNYLKYKQRKS